MTKKQPANESSDNPQQQGAPAKSTEPEDAKDSLDADTTRTETAAKRKKAGEDPLTAAAAEDAGEIALSLVAHARPGEAKRVCWERLRQEARAAGMPRGQGMGTAYEWATKQVEVLFPPPEPVIVGELPEADPDPGPIEPEASPAPIPESPADAGLGGLADLPPDWPPLAANATLQAEISWVSANRLRVRSGTGVDLSRALSPAPSYSALSWLETSILFPSKFADISVKATANQDDEKELIRREKLSIEEIRSILKEMLEE